MLLIMVKNGEVPKCICSNPFPPRRSTAQGSSNDRLFHSAQVLECLTGEGNTKGHPCFQAARWPLVVHTNGTASKSFKIHWFFSCLSSRPQCWYANTSRCHVRQLFTTALRASTRYSIWRGNLMAAASYLVQTWGPWMAAHILVV